MNIHEYQAKDLFRRFKVNTSEGKVFENENDAEEYAKSLGVDEFVVKAQIHAGGRGKAGGVKLVKTPEEVRDTVKQMLGMTLVTHQTGPEGKLVNKVYVEKSSTIKKEYYLSLVTDRSTEKNVIGIHAKMSFANKKPFKPYSGMRAHPVKPANMAAPF